MIPTRLPFDVRGLPLATALAVTLVLMLSPAGARGQVPQPTVGTPPTAAPGPVPALASPPSGIRGRIVTIAESQLGYHDHGSFCTRYGPCELWCSLFATWVWRGAGIPIGSLAFTGSMYDWAALTTYVLGPNAKPAPGDAVLFGTGPGSVDTSLHVGIVESVYPRYLVTVEGDTSHRVLRFVVPIHHPTRIGEPGPIYAYASPLRGARAAGLGGDTALPPPAPALTGAQLRAAIANQDNGKRLTPTDRRLRKTIRSLRAFQHMPYRAPGLRIGWVDVDSHGKIVVAVISSGSLTDAQLAWQDFLTSWDDSGAAYVVEYYPSG